MFSVKVVAVFGRRATVEKVVQAYAGAGVSGWAVAGVGYCPEYGVEPIVQFTTIRPDASKDIDAFLKLTARIGRELGEEEVLLMVQGAADASTMVSTSEVAPDGLPRVKHPLHDTFPVCPDCGQKHPAPKEQQSTALGRDPAALLRAILSAGRPEVTDRRGNEVPFGLPDKKRREDN